MAGKPQHKKVADFIHYTVNVYYRTSRKKNPKLIFDGEAHERELNRVIEDFNSELARRYPQWDTQENRDAFKHQLGFLTGVFKKKEKITETKSAIQLYLEEIAKANAARPIVAPMPSNQKRVIIY